MVDTSHTIDPKILKQVSYLEPNSPIFIKGPFQDLGQRPPKPIPLVEKPSNLKLKPLLVHLKYAFLREEPTLLAVISFDLTLEEEESYYDF